MSIVVHITAMFLTYISLVYSNANIFWLSVIFNLCGVLLFVLEDVWAFIKAKRVFLYCLSWTMFILTAAFNGVVLNILY